MNKEVLMAEARGSGDKTKKPFLIPNGGIKTMIEYMGFCYATDRILVDGCPVGYMYREDPDDEADSGWRFLSGDESQEYMDDQWNSGLYSVNTICNYDPEILPFLNAPVGSGFARESRHLPLRQIEE